MSNIHIRSNSILRLCCYYNIYEVDKVVGEKCAFQVSKTDGTEEKEEKFYRVSRLIGREESIQYTTQ